MSATPPTQLRASTPGESPGRNGVVTVVERGAPAYPPLLAAVHDPPARLYVRGSRIDRLHGPAVAIVGARSCSGYGARVARLLGRELAAAGVVVVSGMARGIDGEAHRGALEVGGTTVAVLGCGIDRDYPRAHGHLAARIVVDGLVIAEYPPGVEPAPWRFPARNRIIAGLALATVVVEARLRSGALITADFALEQGRDVFAVPGPITSSLCAGTNALIRQGAAPALEAGDVLGAIGVEPPPRPDAVVGAEAGRVLALLAAGKGVPDELACALALPTERVAALLVELELAGLAAEDDGRWEAAHPAV